MQAKPMPTRQTVMNRLKQGETLTEVEEAICAELDIVKEKLQRFANAQHDK